LRRRRRGRRWRRRWRGCGSTSRSTAPPAQVREINKTGRFRADGRTAYGKPVSFGTFATAVDAAVAYARAVAEMKGAESIAEDEAAAITPRRAEKRARSRQPGRHRRNGVQERFRLCPPFLPPPPPPGRPPPPPGPPPEQPPPLALCLLAPEPPLQAPAGRAHRPPGAPSPHGRHGGRRRGADPGLQAYAAAFEGYDDIEYVRGLDAAERAEVATETGMKPGHAGRWGKYGFGEA